MNNDIHTRPKSREVFDKIRMHILEGEYRTGEWLKQAELEERYGATRSEVRGALSTLAERGIVEYIKNRGFQVFKRSDEDIAQISEMICVLESGMAEKIIQKAAPSDIAKVAALGEEFAALLGYGTQAELRMANYRFHAALISLCGNRVISDHVRNLRECCASGPELRYMHYEGLLQSHEEHNAMLSAIKERDVPVLQKLFVAHASHDRN